MKYQIRRTSQFKKDFDAIRKRNLDIDKFVCVINLLVEGKPLPEKYCDHPLRNSKEYKNCRELHIEPNWLLVYKYSNDNLILVLVRSGTHSDLFS